MKKCWLIFIPILVYVAGLFSPNTLLAEDFPRFPWETYGQVIDYAAKSEKENGDDDEEFKFSGHVEQGVDWCRIGAGGPILNTFIGLDGIWTSLDTHWWDRYVSPSLGIKLVFPFSHGSISMGIKGEYFGYVGDDTDRPYDDEWRAGIYLGWYAGGFW